MRISSSVIRQPLYVARIQRLRVVTLPRRLQREMLFALQSIPIAVRAHTAGAHLRTLSGRPALARRSSGGRRRVRREVADIG